MAAEAPWLGQIHLWQIDAFAGAVVAVTYFAIGMAMVLPIVRHPTWASGMALAIAAVFLVAGARSAMTSIALAFPGPSTAALRASTLHWVVVLDLLAAVAGLYYWTLRRGYRDYVKGGRLLTEVRDRQRVAMEIHDNIVQGLATAQLALDLGELDQVRSTLDATMAAAKRIISGPLTERGGVRAEDRDLRRSTAAQAPEARP